MIPLRIFFFIFDCCKCIFKLCSCLGQHGQISCSNQMISPPPKNQLQFEFPNNCTLKTWTETVFFMRFSWNRSLNLFGVGLSPLECTAIVLHESSLCVCSKEDTLAVLEYGYNTSRRNIDLQRNKSNVGFCGTLKQNGKKKCCGVDVLNCKYICL